MQTHCSNSFDGKIELVRTICENDNAFAVAHLKGIFTPTNMPLDQPVHILFQLTDDNHIGRMFWYLNTYPFVAIKQ